MIELGLPERHVPINPSLRNWWISPLEITEEMPRIP